MTDIDLDQLAEELSDFDTTEKPVGRSLREERVIAGFEDILRFAKEQGRAPQHGEKRDIFERLYAVRLDRLRALEECRALLEPLDHQGLLTHGSLSPPVKEEEINEDMLAAELAMGTTSITELKHVRPSVERRADEEIAKRQPCNDFACFKPLFEQIQNDLETGIRKTRPFNRKAGIEPGRFFIVGGQKAYVAEMGEVFTNAQGRTDARLRVIFDNGTQSDLLMRSLSVS